MFLHSHISIFNSEDADLKCARYESDLLCTSGFKELAAVEVTAPDAGEASNPISSESLTPSLLGSVSPSMSCLEEVYHN